MRANSISLKEWQAPQEDVLMQFSEANCEVYFRVWDEDRELKENLIGKLCFKRAWSVRSVRSECCPHLTSFEGRSSILEVTESDWYKQIDEYYYTDFSKSYLRDNSCHYIVRGHDIFFEILAEGFTENYIDEKNKKFSSILEEL